MSAAMVSIPLTELDMIRSELGETKAWVTDLKGKIASMTVEVTEVSYQTQFVRTSDYGEPRKIVVPVRIVSYKNMDEAMNLLRDEAFKNVQEKYDSIVRANKELQDKIAYKMQEIVKLEGKIRDLEAGQKVQDDTNKVKELTDKLREKSDEKAKFQYLYDQEVLKTKYYTDLIANKKWYQFWK